MAKTISIINQKGGVGKTTTARNMGAILSKLGRKVLLVDLDPQSNLTFNFGIDLTDKPDLTIASLFERVVYSKSLPPKDDYIKKFADVDLLPSSIDLASMEIHLMNTMSRELMLKEVIKPLKNDYDYIIIDCAPSLGILTLNALAASDEVVIVSTPQFFSAKGIFMLINTISQVQSRINPDIKIMGVLMTMFRENTNNAKKIREQLIEALSNENLIFETVIPVAVKVDEATSVGKCIIEYDPNSKVSVAYTEFVKDLLQREENINNQGE